MTDRPITVTRRIHDDQWWVTFTDGAHTITVPGDQRSDLAGGEVIFSDWLRPDECITCSTGYAAEGHVCCDACLDEQAAAAGVEETRRDDALTYRLAQ